MKNIVNGVSVYSTIVGEELRDKIEFWRQQKGLTKSEWKRLASEKLVKTLELQQFADEYFEMMRK